MGYHAQERRVFMQRFEGDKDFPQAPGDLWPKLTDARFLVTCIPDAEQVKEAEADHAVFVVRPGLAFMRGSLDVSLRLLDLEAPRSAKILLESKGIGSTSAVELTVTLTPLESGTRAHWSAEIKELGGLLKMVPGGLIKGAAQKVITEILDEAETKLQD
jgi:carbon monoxide dehydrogenase subunit G